MKILMLFRNDREREDGMRKFINHNGSVIEEINKRLHTIRTKDGITFYFGTAETNLQGMEFSTAIIDELVPGAKAMEALTRVR